MDSTATAMGVQAAALDYLGRGWQPIPIPRRSKKPGREGWQHERRDEAAVRRDLNGNGQPQNIGVLLGEPSDWLVDIDLDHLLAVELAPEHLPATHSVFGRASKPRSHYLYQATAPIGTKQWRSKVYGTLVELRSTGGQTVFPPSAHDKTGESIEWAEDGNPAKMDPDRLTSAVETLAQVVVDKLGVAKVDAAFSAMMKITVPDHQDGSLRLYTAACRAVEHDLTDRQAIDAIRAYEHERPFARDWSDDDILKRVRDAEQKQPRGQKTRPDPKEESYQPEPIVFPRVSCIELDRTTYQVEFHVEGMLAARQPCILAGGKKSLKTNTLIDLGISLSQGGYWLGKFPVRRACRVGIMSGESGMPVIQETARRICGAAGYRLEDVGGLVFSDRVPRLDSPTHLDGLREWIMDDELEVVAVDPAYLALPGADAGNLFLQGEMLSRVNELAVEMGVTFILVHHTRKRREGYAGDFDPVELSEIAWSGFQEWARQWLLIGRREPYAPGTGTHRLWLTAGGSVGHSSLWALDIEEGLYPDRCWDVRCLHPDEAYAEDADRTRARDEKTSQLRDRKRLDDDVARLVDAAMRYPGGETATRLRDASGLQDARFKKALAEAIDAGHVESCEVKKTNRRAPYEGYKPVAQ